MSFEESLKLKTRSCRWECQSAGPPLESRQNVGIKVRDERFAGKKKTIRHLLVTGKAAFWNVFSQQFSSVLSEFTAASHPALLIKEEARLAKSKPNCSSTVNQPSSVTLIYHLNASWGHSVLSSYSSLLEPLWDWFQATDYYCKIAENIWI